MYNQLAKRFQYLLRKSEFRSNVEKIVFVKPDYSVYKLSLLQAHSTISSNKGEIILAWHDVSR